MAARAAAPNAASSAGADLARLALQPVPSTSRGVACSVQASPLPRPGLLALRAAQASGPPAERSAGPPTAEGRGEGGQCRPARRHPHPAQAQDQRPRTKPSPAVASSVAACGAGTASDHGREWPVTADHPRRRASSRRPRGRDFVDPAARGAPADRPAAPSRARSSAGTPTMHRRHRGSWPHPASPCTMPVRSPTASTAAVNAGSACAQILGAMIEHAPARRAAAPAARRRIGPCRTACTVDAGIGQRAGAGGPRHARTDDRDLHAGNPVAFANSVSS